MQVKKLNFNLFGLNFNFKLKTKVRESIFSPFFYDTFPWINPKIFTKVQSIFIEIPCILHGRIFTEFLLFLFYLKDHPENLLTRKYAELRNFTRKCT